MSAKLIAAEATTATVATTTVYTVPSSRAARLKMMWQILASASGTTTVSIAIGAATIMQVAIPVGQYFYTASPLDSPGNGLFLNLKNLLTQPAAGMPAMYLSPLAQDYILSAAQTVTYTISGNAAQSVLFKIQGVEDDA